MLLNLENGHIRGRSWVDLFSLPLVWSEGHFWHTSIEADELPLHFEYKFIVVDGERVGRWEKG